MSTGDHLSSLALLLEEEDSSEDSSSEDVDLLARDFLSISSGSAVERDTPPPPASETVSEAEMFIGEGVFEGELFTVNDRLPPSRKSRLPAQPVVVRGVVVDDSRMESEFGDSDSPKNQESDVVSNAGKNVEPTTDWFCAKCGVSCPGEISFHQHLAGRRHNARRHDTLPPVQPGSFLGSSLYSCRVCGIDLVSREKYIAHLRDVRHQRRIPSDRSTFFCDFCVADLETEKNFGEHCRGRRHGILKDAFASFSSSTTQQKAVRSSRWYCRLCGIDLEAERCYREHVVGRKHLLKEASLLEKAVPMNSAPNSSSSESHDNKIPELLAEMESEMLAARQSLARAGSLRNQIAQIVSKQKTDPFRCLKCERRRRVCFLPCTHIPLCVECAAVVERCPQCDQMIAARQTVHLM